MAWERLVAKYEPKDSTDLVELMEAFTMSKLENTEDASDETMKKLEILRMRLKAMRN